MKERMSGAPFVGQRTLFDVALVERDSVRRIASRQARPPRARFAGKEEQP
jgi:hypothetical protein